MYNEAMESTVRLTAHGRELLEAQLAREPMRSPEEVVERALETLACSEALNGTRTSSPRKVTEAVAGILTLQKRNKLGGLKIKDLIHEGHKF